MAIDLDEVELETLEVIELDAAGRRIGSAWRDECDSIPELAYGRDADPTSLAGIWEALARS
ncbi:MAG TPA: hypothetical protein VMP86_00550 [Candidatus Binatia bacterium]|nr:hypothetical protein [Candidatus Binatia bacterium]